MGQEQMNVMIQGQQWVNWLASQQQVPKFLPNPVAGQFALRIAAWCLLATLHSTVHSGIIGLIFNLELLM
jgi:hypothetical protein